MSQSNDSLAPCADKEGHGEAIISLHDALRSGPRGQKKRNLATVTIVDPPTRKRKRNSWVWKVMQQFLTPYWKMLHALFGGVQRLSRSEEEKGVRGRLHWRW